jgi:hypothetical protein
MKFYRDTTEIYDIRHIGYFLQYSRTIQAIERMAAMARKAAMTAPIMMSNVIYFFGAILRRKVLTAKIKKRKETYNYTGEYGE